CTFKEPSSCGDYLRRQQAFSQARRALSRSYDRSITGPREQSRLNARFEPRHSPGADAFDVALAHHLREGLLALTPRLEQPLREVAASP
ncbi:MAG: hypothetical protein M3Q48_12810, partial [Actinomycetota bacterium]|nr:hypothetical protein [Actinomycetota bacterium]